MAMEYASTRKRKREGESKQALLRWLYERGCAACKVTRYSASVEVLAAVKKDHVEGRHAWAASGDTTGAAAAAASPTDSVSMGGTPCTPPRAPVSLLCPTDEACKILQASPCSADRETFIFQQPLIRVITDRMPSNDKFDSGQEIKPWMRRAMKKMVEPVRLTKKAYQAGKCDDKFGELQDRPHLSAIFTGLKSIMPTSQQIAARESPMKYMEKIRKADGSFMYVEKNAFPPPRDANAAHELSSKKDNLRWVMDILMFTCMGGSWSMDGVATWIPKVIAECKWSLKPEDLYQAALGAARLQLFRLKRGLPIDRLYLKVWSAQKYRYGILDVFGHVRVKNGRVTSESFEVFENQVSELRRRCGDSFKEEAFKDAPTTAAQMEVLFGQRETEFRTRFSGIRLPADVVAPVGVLYLCPDARPFPTGEAVVEEKDAAVFYQGMLRALGSNSVLGWEENHLEENMKQMLVESEEELPFIRWQEEPLAVELPEQPQDQAVLEPPIREELENYRLGFEC